MRGSRRCRENLDTRHDDVRVGWRAAAPGRGLPTKVLATGAVLALAMACGSGSEQVVRPPESEAPAGTTTPTSTPTTPTSQAPRQLAAALHPATGLVEGQSVAVTGSGFSRGLALVVVQCLDRGTATGSGDCNLSGLVSVHADASGNVATHLRVSKGPFGTPPVLCSRTQRCLVSITEAALSPTEEADAAISFR